MTEHLYTDEIKQIYGGDPREIPLYGLTDTSRYLKIHIQTLKSWIYGRKYKLKDGTKIDWPPVIKLPDSEKPLLSFYNLVEVHVLCGIRRIHNVQFNKVRTTLDYLESQFHSDHPLAKENFWTDNFHLFIKKAGNVICTSMSGQQVIEEVVSQYLDRVDKKLDLTPFRLYPFSKGITFQTTDVHRSKTILEALPKNIVIDPLISFGRPTMAGTGVPTNVIAGRFRAGEKIDALAGDYEIEAAQIQEALEYEGVSLAAA